MRWITAGVIIAILFSSCTTAPRGGRPAGVGGITDAEYVLDALKSINNSIDSFKGLGTLRLQDGDLVQSYRVAWAGAGEDRLRFEVMGPAGQTVVRIAIDGHYLYFHSTYPQRFLRRPLSNTSLKHLTKVPIKIADLQAFIRGRIPIRPHHRIAFANDRESDSRILYLKNWWGGVVEQIHLNPNQNHVQQVDFFSLNGALAYRAQIEDHHFEDTWAMPKRLVFSRIDANQEFELIVDRFWMNVPVSDGLFTLQNPEITSMQ